MGRRTASARRRPARESCGSPTCPHIPSSCEKSRSAFPASRPPCGRRRRICGGSRQPPAGMDNILSLPEARRHPAVITNVHIHAPLHGGAPLGHDAHADAQSAQGPSRPGQGCGKASACQKAFRPSPGGRSASRASGPSARSARRSAARSACASSASGGAGAQLVGGRGRGPGPSARCVRPIPCHHAPPPGHAETRGFVGQAKSWTP